MNKHLYYIVSLLFMPILLTFVVTAVLHANDSPPNDPIYSTFLGQSGSEEGNSMVIDPSGNVFVTGYTQSTIFPAQTASINHGVDVYAAKLNADGSNFDYILWFNALTFFAEDYGYGIDIDNTGSVYITGITNSDDFCAISGTVPGYNQIYGGSGDAFVLKINPNGTMVYCSFLGGSEWDAGQAIVVDAAGNAYITGSTYSPEFPTTPAAYNTNHAGLTDVFVAKLDSTGTQLLYSTFIGADEREDGRAIALDESNHIYVAGWTRSTNFPTTLGTIGSNFQGGDYDSFLLKLNLSGEILLYSTFLGGADDERPTSIFVDPADHVYVTGYTSSPNFPTTPLAYDPSYNGNIDAFLLKINELGNDLIYGTYLGGSNNDWGYGLDVDDFGVAYITGETWSSNFPTTTLAFDSNLADEEDAFVTQINRDGSNLLYSSYLGGSDWDHGLDIAADSIGHAYVTGETRSADFPTTVNGYDTSHNGDYDIFVTKLPVENTAVSLQTLTLSGPITGSINQTLTFTASVQPESAAQPITYIWQPSGQPPITHTSGLSDVLELAWNTAQTVTITLTAQNAINTLTATHIITISTDAQANFSATPTTGIAPLQVTFHNNSGGDFDSSLWDFGDGITSTIPQPTHTFHIPGSYTITLTISGNGGTDTQVRSNYIHVQPRFLYLPLILGSS
jgi:TM2 domain-containing membrane protein YozV